MKKIILILYLIFCAIINGQEIISLEYDNTGLDYKEPEIKTIGYSKVTVIGKLRRWSPSKYHVIVDQLPI